VEISRSFGINKNAQFFRHVVEHLLPVIRRTSSFCLYHCKKIVYFVNNGQSKCRCRKHKCCMLTKSDIQWYNLCILAIFSKTGFMDIVPLSDDTINLYKFINIA